jgi:hypothetical protein
MPFKKGTSGNPVGRPKGSWNNELRNIINESIDPEKIRDILNKIEDRIDYVNAITNLLPYAIGKRRWLKSSKQLNQWIHLLT